MVQKLKLLAALEVLFCLETISSVAYSVLKTTS
jgi:hypothetical protein